MGEFDTKASFDRTAKKRIFSHPSNLGISPVKVTIRAPLGDDKKKGNILSALTNYDETVYDKMTPIGNNPTYNYSALSGVNWENGKLVYTNYDIFKGSVRFWIEDIPFD